MFMSAPLKSSSLDLQLAAPVMNPPMPQPPKRRSWLHVTGWWAVLLFLPCLGGLAAISLPGFIRFKSRPRQSECRSNLKALFTAEMAYRQEKDRFTPTLNFIGFHPERGNRYAYFAGRGPMLDRSAPPADPSKPWQEDLGRVEAIGVDLHKHDDLEPLSLQHLPPDVRESIGLSGTCPDCDITAACVGQIDRDDTLDVWSVSTRDRKAADGSLIPRGEPYNHVNDDQR
jgi:hypothetical protein